jgi:hypothetical protein
MGKSMLRPNYEAIDQSGRTYIRPALTVDELPLAERLNALVDMRPVISEIVGIEPLGKFSYGLPIYTAFRMTLGQAKQHVHSKILLLKGCDLNLNFHPKYVAINSI